MEKQGNWFDIAKKWEKRLKKKELFEKYLYLHLLLSDSFQFLFVQINQLVSL